MCAVINRISVGSVAVSKTDATHCHADAAWDATKSSGTYSGSYFIWIILNGSQYAEQEIKNSGVGETDTFGGIDFQIAPNDTQSYYLQVADSTKTVKSEMQMLVINTYSGVRSSYDGTRINVFWDKPSGNVGAGILVLTSMEDIVISEDILTNSRHLSWLQSRADFDPDNIWTIVLNPTMNNGVVTGPDSASAYLYTQEPSISAIFLKQGSLQNNKATLTVSFTQPYDCSQPISVLCRLFKDEEELVEYTVTNPMPAFVNNVFSLDFVVPEDAIDPHSMEAYKLKLNLCTANARSMQESNQNVCCLADTQIFKRGYYPVITNGIVTGIAYRLQSDQESSLEVYFAQKLFAEPMNQVIMSGGLKLEPQGTGYLLTLQTQAGISKPDYTSFFDQLSTNNIMIRGLYLLQDAIARGGNLPFTDLLYYHSGVDSANRCADLRPGFTLEVETENYMPVYEIDKLDAASGFVSTHTAQYRISTRDDNGDVRLEFNSFIDQFAEYFDVACGKNAVFAGGVLDFFVKNYRLPLYRIIYPQGFLASDQEQTQYPSDNILMIGAAGYSELSDYTGSINNMPVFSDNSNVPVLIFRGRSALSLWISIWIEGNTKLVPLGTTLGKLLEEQGHYTFDSTAVKVERVSSFGYARIWEKACVKSLPLMLGDRIEVI